MTGHVDLDETRAKLLVRGYGRKVSTPLTPSPFRPRNRPQGPDPGANTLDSKLRNR